MSKDLKTAYIFISLFGCREKEKILDLIEKRKGFLRKSIASKTKLKYNPLLNFSLDEMPEYEKRIDKIIKNMRKNER